MKQIQALRANRIVRFNNIHQEYTSSYRKNYGKHDLI